MEFSISALLNNFAEDKLLAPKALEKKLDCQAINSAQQLQITLEALEKVGILTKERGKYKRLPEEGIVEGKLRCSSKGFCFAIQDQDDTEDIYIRESQLNTAWNGDRVLVKVTKEGRRRRSPEGEVRLILERSNPSVIARVKKTEAGEFRAVPLDDRLLFELVLHPEPEGPDLEAAIDQLVHVEIVRYPLGQLSPLGRVTQVLGSDAKSAADIELVFCKYDLPRSFPGTALEAAEALPKKLRKADQKKRLALQDIPTVTICENLQPAEDNGKPNPKQLDHAFSVEKLKGNQWRVGVHVTDLVHYIPLESPLDRQANQRSASMFLGDSTLPLYPDVCIERIGALTAGKEHLAISILITLNKKGEVLEFELQPSVIQVDQNLDYEQVQAILDGDSTQGKSLSDAIGHLHQMSEAIRQHRYERGSFDLHLPAPPPQIIGDEGDLGAVIVSAPVPAHSMVADLLALANHLVISHLQALAVPVIYQIQAPPDAQDLQDLLKLADNIQLSLSLQQGDTAQPHDFQTFCQTFQTSELSPILFELLQATLKPVQYSTVSGPHFGLALVNNYGHFTSPLNRYSDLINQRVLHAVFTEGRDRRTSRAKDRVNLRHSSCHGQISWNVLPPESQRDLEALITNAIPTLNEQATLARQTSQDLTGLQKTKKMQAHTGEVLQGIITGIQSYGFFVRIETLMVEGLVHVSSLKDDWYEYRSRQQTLVGRKNRCQYRLGDRVEVEVKSVDYYRQQIDLIVVGGGSEAPADEETPTPPDEAGDAQPTDDSEESADG